MRAGNPTETSLMELDPNMAAVAVVTSGIGYLMVMSGIGKSMLEWRRAARMCPGCGRAIRGRACSFCSS
jgi:NADH pyrophosphatase NudC (nudix superfamily)